jgi:hypothetical protein
MSTKVRLRGRVINKITRQPINKVEVKLRKTTSSSSATIAVDVDGEFDYGVTVSSSSPSSQRKYELIIDKDPGYKYKVISFTVSTYSPSKEFGVIELEPYTD